MDFSRQAIKACYALGCSCSPFETMDNEPNTIPDGLVCAGVAGARPDYERPIQRPPCIVNLGQSRIPDYTPLAGVYERSLIPPIEAVVARQLHVMIDAGVPWGYYPPVRPMRCGSSCEARSQSDQKTCCRRPKLVSRFPWASRGSQSGGRNTGRTAHRGAELETL